MKFTAISVGAGIDGSFMLELSRHLNFTPVIIKAKNYDEAMSKMLAKAVGMSVNAWSMRFLNEHVSMTHAMYSDQKCVALRKGSVLRGWHVFLQTFRWDVWLAIICTAIITNWIVALVTRRRSWYEAMPTVLRAMFTVPLRRPPKSTKERIIIASCLLFGIVIMTTYQGNLYYFIKTKVKHKPPTTLSEIRQEIRGRHLPNDTTLTNRVFEKYAIRIRRKIFDLLMQTGQLSNLYLVPECLYTANFAYALRKGSVWLAPLNRFLLSMFEAGFPEAWYRRTVFTKKRISYKGKRKTVKSARVFTLRDLEVAIFVLLLGLTLSFVVFLLEILSATVASRNLFLRWKLKIRHDYVN
uniref:Uncharacterized protein n=1 Tax=Rhodnius prolixus TaxID=13249 RepID=A0A0H2UI72_RHOPR